MADVTYDSGVRRPIHWLFEDRKTGRLVLWQWPNIPLWVWIASMVVGRFVSGGIATAVGAVGSVALAIWAVLEIGWGVNPFRRILGGLVLAAIVVGLGVRLFS
jgi:hypothetical protein